MSFGFDKIDHKSPFLAGIISSVKETEIDVVFHDPKGFLKDAVIHYFWFINTVNYGQTPTVSVVCTSTLLQLSLSAHVEIAYFVLFRVTLSTTSLSLAIMMWKSQRLHTSTQVLISPLNVSAKHASII